MNKSVTLSTLVDPDVKRALLSYCKKRGAKVRFVVEQAIAELLEEELDLQAYFQRINEDKIPLESVLATRKRVRSKKAA